MVRLKFIAVALFSLLMLTLPNLAQTNIQNNPSEFLTKAFPALYNSNPRQPGNNRLSATITNIDNSIFGSANNGIDILAPQAPLFAQDFQSSTTLTSYIQATTPNNGQFNTIGTSGAGVVPSIATVGTNNVLQFTRAAANTGNFTRSTDLAATAPTTLLYKVDVTFSGNTAAATTAIELDLGSGFTGNNSNESNANTYSKIGFNLNATSGSFSVRDISGSANSTGSFTGTQTITWALNNSGSTINYIAPDGSTESLGNDKFDVFVGTTKALDERSVTTATQSITDFKGLVSGGTNYSVQFDNFLIDPITTVAADTTPPTVSSIDDGDGDDIVTTNTTLTYTVTFSEDINASTVTASDFDNAGTAAITIGTITETTATSGIFTVQVTPTTAGTLILRIPTGAVISDTSGNNLAVPVQDDTTVTVNAPVNNPPTITATTGISVERGSTNTNVGIATVTDDGGAGSVMVTVDGGASSTVNGITISNISNNNGAISATITATCGANAAGFTLSASDGVNPPVTTTISIGVTDSIVATQLIFLQQPTNINSGAQFPSAVQVRATNACGATIGSFTGAVSLALNGTGGTLNGTTTVNAVNGVATFNNLSVTGSGTFTLTASSTGLTSATSNSFTVNGAPAITPTAGGITRQQGSPATNSQIAVVSDAETAAGSLNVSVVSAPAGITVSNIINTGGNITANVQADCSAAVGANTIVLRVSDGTATTDGNLTVNVTANTAPMLSYNNPAAINSGGSTTVSPATGPTDNGSITSIVVQSTGTYTGTISVDSAGVVSISNAAPAGTHTITIRATDNCGLTTDATFTLTVNTPSADLAITKTDGVTTVTAGGSVTYTITASNAGPNNVNGATVADTLPASLTNVTWSCVSAGSGTCTASGSGNINDTVNLPSGSSVTYTVNATLSASATGTLSNTATVTAPSGVTDPIPGNNSATDSDTITAQPSLSINDVTLNEGNSGTTSFTFTVSLSAPAPAGGVTFNITTADGTALAPTDYAVNSLTGQTIPAGSSTYSFTVLVFGDTTVEPNETFFVNVTNVTGANVFDGQGLGTITNDDVADTTSPVITYTPIPAKSTAGSSTLAVTVTDNVAVSGVSITYQIGTNTAVTAACTSGGGSSYNCTIDETGGQGTIVKYKVSATDSSSNTSTNPAIGDNGYAIGSNVTIPTDTYGTLNLNSGGTLTGNIVINVDLSNSGIINTNSFVLEVGCNATIFTGSALQYVNGTIQKDFCAPQSFTFPVGNSPAPPSIATESPNAVLAYYTPVTANVTAAVNPSSLTVSETDAFMPGANPTKSVSRYWTLTEGGAITADLSFTYNDADVNGDESLYKVIKNESGATTSFAGSTNNASTNTATVTGITNFSLWSVGALNAPSAASASISGRVRAGNLSVSNAQIMVSGGNLQQPLIVRTNNFGYYSVDGLESGQTYVVTVISKRYVFQQPSTVVNTTESLTEINFDGTRRQ